MATVEVAASVGLIAREEQVKAVEEAVKVTEIEPTTEKASEEEAPAASPAEEVLATEKIVDEGPSKGEDSGKEITVTPPASVAEAESEEEAAQAPEEADPAQEVSVAEAPAENAVVETAAEEKGEEFSAKEEAPAEVPAEKIASAEESAVEEAKPAEAVPDEEKAEGEGKDEE